MSSLVCLRNIAMASVKRKLTGRSIRSISSQRLKDAPSLTEFMQSSTRPAGNSDIQELGESCMNVPAHLGEDEDGATKEGSDSVAKRTFFLETYGCQMNLSDSDVVRSVLLDKGYVEAPTLEGASVILTNTCAIRENAETKVWERLKFLASVGRERRQAARSRRKHIGRDDPGVHSDLKVGILGCMAERLKADLLEKGPVDFVAGPDSYRDLPRLMDLVFSGEKAVNVQLSQDETYADLRPVRRSESGIDAFVSIQRGCDNKCAFCIVPFTRGRERSRDLDSVVEEVRRAVESGVKEVCLLGQNVNSYHDKTWAGNTRTSGYSAAAGFVSLNKNRSSTNVTGAYFADLLEAVADVDPEVRVRFTSPHPRDFSDDVLKVIASRHNVCKQLHLPAQSGSSRVLAAMKRGYSREAYLDLVNRVRHIIPGVAISSDFICGFCGETEQDHEQTLSLMELVEYDQAFMYSYSQRAKTHAAHRLPDDVPPEVKQRRLEEVITTFRRIALDRNLRLELGQRRLVLVEGVARRSTDEVPRLTGKTDGNKRVLLDNSIQIPRNLSTALGGVGLGKDSLVSPQAGDYVLAEIYKATGVTLNARPIALTTMTEMSRISTPDVITSFATPSTRNHEHRISHATG